MAVFAENSPAVVAAAAAALGLPLDHCFRLRLPAANKHSLPEPAVAGPLTLRCALARYADLLSAPNKAALLALAACATDAKEAARLQRLASIEGEASRRGQLAAPAGGALPAVQLGAARVAMPAAQAPAQPPARPPPSPQARVSTTRMWWLASAACWR